MSASEDHQSMYGASPSYLPPNIQSSVVGEPNQHRRVLKLSYTPNRLRLGESGKLEIVPKLKTRRDDRTANKTMRIPEIPMEAAIVAMHPCYRGPKLDGSYYEWMDHYVYDYEMPDIVRRVNKFRGFPQQDDPQFNTVDAEKWQEYYCTDEARAELEPYMPFLRRYWETNGDVFEDHLSLLDVYNKDTDQDDGRVDVIQGFDDSRIMSGRAEAVTGLSTPPTEDHHDRWERESEDFKHDLRVRSDLGQRFLNIVPDAVRDSSDQHGFKAWARANGLLPKSPKPQSPRYSPSTLSSPASSGFYESIQQDRSSFAGPGLIWHNDSQDGHHPHSPTPLAERHQHLGDVRPSLTSPLGPLPLTQNSPRAFQALVQQERSTPVRTNSPTESDRYWTPQSSSWSSVEMDENDMDESWPSIVLPDLSKITDDEWEGAMRQSPMPGMYQLPSAGSYHSPAGDIITSGPSVYPARPEWDQYREHSYVQNLANANGFQATPWMAGHSSVYEDEQNQVDPDDFGSLNFPMGMRRWHHHESPEAHGLRSVRDRTPTPQPEPELCAAARTTKRQREEDADDEASSAPWTPTIVIRQRAPKRRRTATPKRKGGKSKKGRKGRKDGSDDEYEFTGLDVDEEDTQYERVPRGSGNARRSGSNI